IQICSLFNTLASVVKKSVYGIIALELGAAGSAILAFSWLRRSEKSRHYLYTNFPSAAGLYYWAEDSVSFGQKTGTRLRLGDLRRWTKSDTDTSETD
ncbi:hypothetical protein PFISCL1PPCAC_19717, partial [Pristionchus fissidentatus]